MSKVNNEIAVESRKEFGKGASRRSRKSGRIPAVVYSKGGTAESVTLDASEWQVLAGHHAHMVTLVSGKSKKSVLVKEVQFNHLKNYVQHIDFLEVDINADITTKLPVHTHGDCVGVNRGGVLDVDMHEIEVVCHPDKLPEFIVVEIANLEIGEQLHVKDLVLPEGVRCELDPEAIVLHVGRAKNEAEPTGEEAAEPVAIKEKKKDAE